MIITAGMCLRGPNGGESDMDAVTNVQQKKSYTIKDIYALPDGKRAELIDGQIYDMAPPSRTHQKLSMYLANEIFAHIRRNHGKCEVYAAPFAVFLESDDRNYVEPDISVVCDLDKLDEKGCHGAPDWIIEIVSPGSKPVDYFAKLFKYRTAGVREYWIVDPMKKMVLAYRFEKETMEEYAFDEDIPAGIYENFSINMRNR